MVAHVATTVPLDSIRVSTDPGDIPVTKAAVAILAEGWTVVAVGVGVSTVSQRVFLLDPSFAVVDTLNLDGDAYPEMVALEDYTVQLICMNADESISHVIDCSGGSMTLIETYADTTAPTGWGTRGNYTLYLREIGVTVLATRSGVHVYRRGRGRTIFTDDFIVGDNLGICPHPSDPTKFAACYVPLTAPDYEWAEFTVDPTDDSLTYVSMGITGSGDTGYIVGASSPYIASPYFVEQAEAGFGGPYFLRGVGGASWVAGAGSTEISLEERSIIIPESDDLAFLTHEVYVDDAISMAQGYYRVRVVQHSSTAYDGEVIVPYDTTDAASAHPEWTSSMVTGSIGFDRRAGDLVVAMTVTNSFFTLSDDNFSLSVMKFSVPVKPVVTVDDAALGRFPVGDGRYEGGILKLWDGTQWLREPISADGHDVALRPLKVWDDALGAWRLVTMMTDGAPAPTI